MVSPERLPLPDAELSRPALVLAQRFVQRWDMYARQLGDGSYVCVHEPLNVGHLLDHLRGEITLGAYLLDQDSRARFLVLDADDAQAWERLCHLASALASVKQMVRIAANTSAWVIWQPGGCLLRFTELSASAGTELVIGDAAPIQLVLPLFKSCVFSPI